MNVIQRAGAWLIALECSVLFPWTWVQLEEKEKEMAEAENCIGEGECKIRLSFAFMVSVSLTTHYFHPCPPKINKRKKDIVSWLPGVPSADSFPGLTITTIFTLEVISGGVTPTASYSYAEVFF